MKKFYMVAMLATLLPAIALAQLSITGKITDQVSRQPLVGASVSANGSSVVSNFSGEFTISNIKPGSYTFRVSYLGYQTFSKSVTLNSNERLDIAMVRGGIVTDEVIVSSTRANPTSATTYRNLSKEELEKNNLGQDLPYLLNQTPSVVVSSDAGAGVGYTGIRIRGSDATRINVTVNGIPLNDAESQGSFFINLPDFASSVNNIQIQRGVGTSTNGAGAFGASLNIQTTTRRDSSYAELNNSFGSFDTRKHTLNVGTGLINNKFSFDGRLSQIKSDGYIDRAFSNLKSFFVTGAYYGKKDLIRANVFSGAERTYQAWNGVDSSTLSKNRTHNDFTYDNQTDNYQQDHYQLFYTHTFTNKLYASTALHYTYGRGYYEEYKTDQALSKYNLAPVDVNGTSVTESDVVRRLWLDNDFYGLTYSLNYTPSTAFNLTFGGAYNEYKGKHFDEVIWAQFANYSAEQSLRHRYNDNDAFKTDFNIYGKANFVLTPKFNLFADMQFRRIHYSFLGFDGKQQEANLNFYNPKVGATYHLNNNSNVYASLAIGNKEPNRRDFTESTPDSRPKHENLTNFELGYRVQQSRFSAGVNGYAMLYKNQLVATGELNDVGGLSRKNVPDSYRAGIEFDGRAAITRNLRWAATATFSRNKIKKFTEFIYDVDGSGAFQTFEYNDTDISFSPSVIASSELGFSFAHNAEIAFISKYVGKQYLDNRSDELQKLPSFFVNDVRIGYSTAFKGVKQIGLNLLINNVFNTLYENNGYSYNELNGGEVYRGNGYYPQATRNFLLGLSLKF